MSEEKEIKRAVAAVGAGASSRIEKSFGRVTEDVMSKEFLPKNALGMSDAMVEGVYGQAYRLYNTGKYKEASELFRLLIMMDSTQAKYTMGLAACFHMMKEYQAAVSTYTLCGVMDPESPVPFYHASDCYLEMKDITSSIVALEMAVKRAGIKGEYQALKDRALLTIESLKKEMNKEDAKKNEIKAKHKKK